MQRTVLPQAYRYLDTLIPQAQRVRVRAVWSRAGSPARLASHTQLHRKRSSTLNSSAATTTTTDDLPRRQGTLYCWTPCHWNEWILFVEVANVKGIHRSMVVRMRRKKEKNKMKSKANAWIFPTTPDGCPQIRGRDPEEEAIRCDSLPAARSLLGGENLKFIPLSFFLFTPMRKMWYPPPGARVLCAIG